MRISQVIQAVCMITFLTTSPFWAHARTGGGGTGGGDPDAIEFIFYAGKACDWLGRIQQISSVNTESCKSKTQNWLKNLSKNLAVSIVRSSGQVEIMDSQGVPKPSTYDRNSDSIIFSRSIWESFETSKKFETAAVEMAGIFGSQSRYEVGRAAFEYAQYNFPDKTERGSKTISTWEYNQPIPITDNTTCYLEAAGDDTSVFVETRIAQEVYRRVLDNGGYPNFIGSEISNKFISGVQDFHRGNILIDMMGPSVESGECGRFKLRTEMTAQLFNDAYTGEQKVIFATDAKGSTSRISGTMCTLEYKTIGESRYQLKGFLGNKVVKLVDQSFLQSLRNSKFVQYFTQGLVDRNYSMRQDLARMAFDMQKEYVDSGLCDGFRLIEESQSE